MCIVRAGEQYVCDITTERISFGSKMTHCGTWITSESGLEYNPILSPAELPTRTSSESRRNGADNGVIEYAEMNSNLRFVF